MNGYLLIRPQSAVDGRSPFHSVELEAGKATKKQGFRCFNCLLDFQDGIYSAVLLI